MAKKVALQDRIKGIQSFFQGIEIKGNLYITKVVYPDKWRAFPSKEGLINTTRAETSENLWFYYANIDEVELDEIFDLIEETIKTNESAERKVEILRSKMLELKELFSDDTIDIEKLETIKFVFGSDVRPKRTKRGKSNKDKEVSNAVKEEVAE